MSLKHKLTLLFAVPLLLLFAIIVLAAPRATQMMIEADLEESMRAASEEIQRALSGEIARHGRLSPQSAEEVLHYVLYSDEWLRQVVRGGELRYSPSPFLEVAVPIQAVMPGPERRDGIGDLARERTYQQVYTFVLERNITARLKLEASLGGVGRFADRTSRLFLLILGLLLLSLVALIYYISTRLVSSPLGELSSMTRRVASGDLEVEPAGHLLDRHDEVGVLSASFRNMLSALRQARDENQGLLEQTRGFNRELEARVQEATSALEVRNRLLGETREELARRERFAALGQLAGSIAHEIGTPLSTLSGYLQLVLADRALTSEVREPLEVAAGEARRVTRIIRRFLDSTRGLRPAPESLELRALLDNALELSLPPSIRDRHPVRLELSPDATAPVTDPGLLRQVLINLLRNAIDAMGESGALTLRAQRSEGDLVLEVEDEGPGIPEDQRTHIFEPFFTTKEAGRGTGLGLSICQEIMRALQGSLTVHDAREGHGVRFVVRVPAFPTE